MKRAVFRYVEAELYDYPHTRAAILSSTAIVYIVPPLSTATYLAAGGEYVVARSLEDVEHLVAMR